MKPVEKVSIGGYVFDLEEDACKAVSNYLGRLEEHYSCREGGAEIMEGIEERMAELLLEKTHADGVATVGMVNDVIGVLGRPEAIEAESDLEEEFPSSGNMDPSGAESPQPAPSGRKPRRRLYRDIDNKMLGGVCAGLGVFTKTDPIVYRLIFVLFTIFNLWAFVQGIFWFKGLHIGFKFLFPLIYLILWVVTPPAKTARERWAMKGETGSVDDVEKSFRSSAKEVKASVRDAGRRTVAAAKEAGSSPAGRAVGRAILVCTGALLLVTGVALAVGETAWLFGGELFHLTASKSYLWSELTEEWPDIAEFLSQPLSRIMFLLVAGLPALGMTYGGIMLLFNLKAPNWHPGLVIFVLWLIAVVTLSVLTALTAVNGIWIQKLL